jgi:hypothetical protein
MRKWLVGILLIGITASVRADILIQYAFPQNVDQTNLATTVAASLSASLFNVYSNATSYATPSHLAYGTVGNPAANANKSGNIWLGQSATNGFYGFTLSIDPGYSVDITDVRFDGRATGTGVTNYLTQYSTDNLNFFTLGSGTYANDSTWRTNICNTSVPSGLTGTTYIRIYGFGQNSGGFNVDNVTLNGTVMAIPEPASMALLVLGLGALAFARKRFTR